MSDQKKAQFDVLSESHIPSDLLTPTLGSNYGMPGYEDLEYGMGVLEGVLNPDLHPAPALPTGLSKAGAESALDITEMVNENPITDLSWLEPDPAQDPERLPKNPHQVLPELEALWGESTNGVTVFPNSAPAKVQELPAKRASASQLMKVATHAMRRVVQGHDVDEVVNQAMESVGEDMARLAPTMRALKAESGLLGNVYIRAAAYPKWGGGKWSKAVRKLAKDARYIIVPEGDQEQATWVQNGRCAYTGKLVVSEVPWEEALEHYAPRLAGAGFPVPEGVPAKEGLRQAFLASAKKTLTRSQDYVSEQRGQADLSTSRLEGRAASAEHSVKSVAAAAKQRHRSVARVAHQRERALKAKFIQELLSSGQVSAEEVRGLSLELKSVSKVASALREKLAEADRAVYDKRFFHSAVDGNPDLVAPKQADRQLRRKARKASSRQAAVNAVASQRLEATTRKARSELRVRALVARVEDEIARGARGSYLRKFIVTTIPKEDVKFASTLLGPVLRKTGALNDAPAEASVYEGAHFTRPARSERTAKSVLAGQISKAASWVRRTMSEGFAGSELDSLIEQRIASSLLEASSEAISELRATHEGGSGFLYVDSEAYASQHGVEGCKTGALRHRANQIPAVSAMARCATCTLAREMPDGTRKCGAYNKALLEDVSGPELSQLKHANIQSSNMTDAEATASYFAPTYEHSEYGLRNANLEGLSLSLPENEKVQVVMTKAWNFEV